MSKTPGESRIPMLFASRQQPRIPRGSVPGSPTASAASSQRGSAPGSPTAPRRLASPRRGVSGAAPPEHGASRSGMPALRQGLGQGRINRLTKSASASSTRAMASEPVMRPSRATRPTSFPKPMVAVGSDAAPRPVIDSTTRESSPVGDKPSTGDAGPAAEHPVAQACFDWNPDGIQARHVGCRVQIAGERTGTLRYFGPIALAPGDFCGVELDSPDGKHDGTVRGVCYFRCRPLHGLLAPLHLVRLCGPAAAPAAPGDKTPTSALDSVDSGPHSFLDLGMMDHRMLEADEAPSNHHLDLGNDVLSSLASTPTSATGEDHSPGAFGGAFGAHGHGALQPPHFLHLMEKQNSFDLDESLGILTPDQMADGFTVCDGSSPEEEAAAASVPTVEAMDVDDEHMDVDVHQVVEMVDSALRCTLGYDDAAMLEHGLDDAAPQDDANATVAQDATAVDYLALSRKDGGASTSDYISEDLTSKRLDRTPSVEELPLDGQQQQPCAAAGPGGATPGVATPSRSSARGGKTPNSIITSVTSIASLDTGYQGDAEWSRPGSRGGETDDRHSPTQHHASMAGIKIKGTAVDPMTDSDFFTESDADMQEDRLGVAGRGGDRHAQVIDGTLYGTGAPGATHRPSHGEDMDSSGIYSDLERTQGGSSLAPSTATSMHGSATSATMQLKEGRTLASLNQELVETLKSMLPSLEATEPAADEHGVGADDLGSMTSLVTVKSLQQQQQQQQQQQAAPAAAAPPPKPAKAVREIKKYKMPNRNVTSKVKAMMVVTRQGEDQENTAPKRPPRTTPKKWEAVMQKIASNAEEQSNKLARLKDVKGKVLSSMGVSPTAMATRGSRSNSLTVANVALTRKASSSPRSGDLRKAKSRRHRLEAPSSAATPVMSPDQRSAASTPRSSISDVSSVNNLSNRSKKNRSSSPLSDVSTNSTRTKSATLPTPRATAHGGSRERSSKDKAVDNTNADVLKKNQRNKTSVTPVLPRADKAWSGGGRVVDNKPAVKSQTPSPRKTTQRRATPLKDHNGRLEPVAKQQQQNGVSAVPLPARRAAARPAGQQGPSPQEVAAEVRRRLLPDLRHNAAAFEAMAVLLDYTTTKLGAFAAPALRRDLEKMKTDMANTVLQLEEAQAQYRRLEEERAQQAEKAAAAEAEAQAREEARERAMADLQQRLAGHDEEVQTLTARHTAELAALRGQMDSRAVEAADAVAVATRGLREEYEMELDRVTRRHEETLRAALGAARLEAERDAARLGEEAARREAELAAQLRVREAAHEALREQSRRVMDSMKSDKDARTQALAARCRELQDEVDSLRSVLELRCDELQKSRRENDALRIAADQLPGAEQRIGTLTARLEDLQVQLDRKGELESKLQMENSELQQSFCKETKEKQMLSLQNEQLQFKLKQNTEVVNALAANMSDFHDVSAILNASLANGLTPDRSRRSVKGSNNNNNNKTSTPPESPKVKGVVEKSESVSYMLEMEADSTDDVVARIYRRMASTPLASPAHQAHHAAHPRSAPPTARRTPQGALGCPLSQSASATTIPTAARPTPKQRALSGAAPRVRSRSISSDSGECLSSGNWSPPASLPQRRTPEPAVVVDEHLLVAAVYDCSDIEDFSSSKSSSMSCSSEGSELGVAKEAVAEDESDAGPFQHPQDLDLMTASCGSSSELLLAKQATLPKDAGGEEMAMDDAANGIHSSSEDGSASDEDDVNAGRGRKALAGLPRLSLAMPMTPTAGCGQSAINTPMDSSWSEDMELPVSLSET